MNDGVQQKTKRIYKNMPFLTLDFLSCIVAIRVDRGPPFSALFTIREALKTDGPAIVDAVVVANEIPNIPDLELELPENYAMAKVKEAVLAFTGG